MEELGSTGGNSVHKFFSHIYLFCASLGVVLMHIFDFFMFLYFLVSIGGNRGCGLCGQCLPQIVRKTDFTITTELVFYAVHPPIKFVYLLAEHI